jgi:glycosyltransferase involved in cell wall biosynthesis
MDFGGGEKLVRTLSQQLRIPGFTNAVICFDRIKVFQKEFEDAGIPLILIKRRQCVFDISILPSLVRLIKKNRIRMIHAHDLSSLAYAVAAGRIAGAKIIMTEHSRHYIDESVKRRWEKWLLVMGCSRLIEVSPELKTASVTKDHVPERCVEVIENGINIEKFRNVAPIDLRGQLKIPEDGKLLLTAGRLETIKGQQYLIQALANLKKNYQKVHVILAGDGHYRANLEQQVDQLDLGDAVHFLGARNDIPQLMAACDMLVIPSESEGLPFVLLEAMAAGLPVIATRVGRISKIIGNNVRGLIVPPKNADALADAVLKMFEKEVSSCLSEKALNYVRENYDEKKMIESYKQIYLDSIV